MAHMASANQNRSTARRSSGEGAVKRFDIGGLVPGKGDPRRAPEWLPRALAMAVITVFAAIFIWNSWGMVSWIAVDLVICLFLALAMEPMVLWFIRHGWTRPAASMTSWIIVIVACIVLVGMFGQMFVTQVAGLASNAPNIYSDFADFIKENTPWQLPPFSDLGMTIASNWQSSWATDLIGTAWSTVSAATNFAVSLMIVLFVTYYFSSASPQMRRTICSWLRPSAQRRFLVVWTVIQEQVSTYLSSRVILAGISSVCMAIYMIFTHAPYWLPLCLIYAIISQFIPMIGAFIGAILPVIVVWSDQGLKWALIMVVYITIYQQIENTFIAPKVQQRTMSVHPAVGLLSVFVFGAIFGAWGAFLALPITASIQVIFSASVKKRKLIDSPLLEDPKAEHKSKVVKASEAFNASVLRPLAEHLPRSSRGSSRRVMTSTDYQLQAVAKYVGGLDQGPASSTQLDESATVAIPKGAIGPEFGAGAGEGTHAGGGTQSGASDSGATPIERLAGTQNVDVRAEEPGAAAEPAAADRSSAADRSAKATEKTANKAAAEATAVAETAATEATAEKAAGQAKSPSTGSKRKMWKQ